MQDYEWLIIRTETTGIAASLFVVELAAQRMQGWQPDGPAFHRLLNHGTTTPQETSRVHGYTREILEQRDGEMPHAVYREFSRYAESRPIVAYELARDWDNALLPEWHRLGLAPIGSRGFCLLRLAQRLLDPVPVGSYKIQTLRQYYNLPARCTQTALGAIETAIDLWQQVLRPLAEGRGLHDWGSLATFSEATWFPSRIPFGKFKGRLFRDAQLDETMRDWLVWLAASTNMRSAEMGSWYLSQLDLEGDTPLIAADYGSGPASPKSTLVVFRHPDTGHLKSKIEAARSRLAELELTYTRERHAVSTTQARLFELLRPMFQKRDQLKLRLYYRRKYLETLLYFGEEDAAAVDEELDQARSQSDAEYEQAAAASLGRRPLSEDEERELKRMWRKLVRLFHPDRYMDDEDKQAIYQKLTAEINRARDAGDIECMREIADDPQGFIARQGWGFIALEDSDEFDKLGALYELLEGQIIELLEALDVLHASAEYELHLLVAAQPDLLVQVAAEQSRVLEEESKALEAELERVEKELVVLQA